MHDLKTSVQYGPFSIQKGVRVKLNDATYELKTSKAGEVTFLSLANGVSYGPFQVVEGRLGVIGRSTYCFHAGSAIKNIPSESDKPVKRNTRRENSPKEVAQPPPAMPEMIDVPEQQPARVVPPKYLPRLPETPSVFRGYGWLAFVDNTPLDWKLNSADGGDGALERFSLGGDIAWNHWFGSLSLSPFVKCGDIVAPSTGITGASFDDGTGWSIGIGYRRPVLVEGGWSASAGIRGQIRQDSGDLSTHTLISTGESDTNVLGNVKSEYRSNTTSLTLRELSLWLDVELAYNQDCWGVYADCSIQPVSEYNVSGSIPYGTGHLSVDVERSTPIAISFGGWYGFDRWRLFSDFSVGADRLFRIGCGYDF